MKIENIKLKIKNSLRSLRVPLRALRETLREKKLGGTMPQKKITPLCQGNKYWMNEVVGILPIDATEKYKQENTIAKIGCVLTSYCMLLEYLTGIKWFPHQLNYLLKKRGGFAHNLVVHSALSYLFPEFIFGGLFLCTDVPAPVSDITLMLPTLIKIDYNPYTTEIEGHWVLALEYNKNRDDYLIADPLTGEFGYLLKIYGKKGWGLDRIILTAVRRS